MIEIVRPKIERFPSFTEYAEEMRAHGETLREGHYPKPGETPEDFVQRLAGREIRRLLLTCSPNNPASNWTILANGGKLEKTVFVDFSGEDRNHYWIDLECQL